jgi:competence protein ComEC
MQRPLAAVVVAYGAGVLLAQGLPVPLPFLCALLSVILLALVIVAVIHHRAHGSASSLAGSQTILVWLLLAAFGWTNFTLRTAVRSPHDLRVLLGAEPAMVTVRGILAETPRLKITVRDGEEMWRSLVQVSVRELGRNGTFEPATGDVLVTTPEVLNVDFFRGQPVEVAGVIASPSTPLAEGMFDYRHYLATHGIYFQLRTESANDWKLLSPHRSTPPLTDRFLNWSRDTLALGLPVEDEPLRLLWAMTLGWRTAFTGDIAEPFLQAGTQHLFAIDGLRIALVSGMIIVLLRLLRISRGWCGLVAAPAIWFYTAATGWEPSAVRASVMMTVVLGGWALKRPGDLLNSLAAAACVILVLDPRQMFEAGFLLSFFVMLVIALVLPVVTGGCDRLIDRWLKADPLLPDELVPGWRKQGVIWTRRFAHFCALSFAAWLGCLPLAAKFFHLLSPVSTPANVVAVPIGTLALVANLGALICGHWLTWFTVLFNHAAWFLMVAMTWVSVQAAHLPGACFYVPEPSWFTIVIYYAGIVAAFSGWFHTTRRQMAGAALLLFIAAGYGWQWQAHRADTELTVLPLAGGQAVYVDAAGRCNDWLVNCGSQDAVDLTLKDFLRAQGVNTLPRLVLSDASIRNCGGAQRLDELFSVGELWTGAAPFHTAAYHAAVSRFEALTNAPGSTGRHHLFHYGDATGCWQVLFPVVTNAPFRAGDGALVLRGNFSGTRILLLSDLSRTGQSELLGLTNDLRADIVITGLPDEGEPLCDALIAAAGPKVIVVADSASPANRRSPPALKERLERMHIPVVYTRTAGAVKIDAGPSGWVLTAMAGQRFEGETVKSKTVR